MKASSPNKRCLPVLLNRAEDQPIREASEELKRRISVEHKLAGTEQQRAELSVSLNQFQNQLSQEKSLSADLQVKPFPFIFEKSFKGSMH